MNDQPLVSIITPVYNSACYIKETMFSVINQTYMNWEHILIDDCSTDDSINIIDEIAAFDQRIKLFKSNRNLGAGPARNLGIKNAQGDIIAFLDSDDIWHYQKLELHVSFMLKNNAAFSHTSYGFVDETGKIIRDTFHVSSKPVTYRMALKRTEISCLTAMYDVRKIGKTFMPDIRRKQDYALWLTILKKGFNSIPLDIELAWYRQRKDSATNNKSKLIIKHYFFLHKEIGLSYIKSIQYTLYWIWNGLFKYFL